MRSDDGEVYKPLQKPTARPSIWISSSSGACIDHGRADGGVIGEEHDRARPGGEKCLRVASSPMRTAAICPCSTSGWRRMQTMSPSQIVGAMLLPWQVQGKIRVPRGGDPDIALDVLLRRDGRAAGNGAHQRYPRHFRQGLKPRRRGGGGLNAQQPGRSGVQRGGQLFQLGLGQVVDPFFQFGDGGFGAVSHPVGQAPPVTGRERPGAPGRGVPVLT